MVEQSPFQAKEGGSIPTPPLQFQKTGSELQNPSLWLEEIPLETAAEFVLQHHYSKVMPKQTKLVLGLHKGRGGPLVGAITFGWGVRPKDTIRRLFPSLRTEDYLEIGKMCVHDSEPKNTESRLLSLSMKWIKKHRPTVKLIFTWADALWGKPGYVYQAANFYYGGFIWTDVYMDKKGRRFHPRQLPAMYRSMGFTNEKGCWYDSKGKRRSDLDAQNKMGCGRPRKEHLVEFDFKHIFGMQFRYVFFLVSDSERDVLIADSAESRIIKYVSTRTVKGVTTAHDMTPLKPQILWTKPTKLRDGAVLNPYPKEKDMQWKIDNGRDENGKVSKPKILRSKPKFGSAFDPSRDL